MNKFHFNNRFSSRPAGRIGRTISIAAGIFILLVSVAWAQGPDQMMTGGFNLQNQTAEGAAFMGKSTIHELITIDKKGRDDDDGDDDFDGSGTCTIIPWLCGSD